MQSQIICLFVLRRSLHPRYRHSICERGDQLRLPQTRGDLPASYRQIRTIWTPRYRHQPYHLRRQVGHGPLLSFSLCGCLCIVMARLHQFGTMIAILFSLKTMESLQIGVTTHFWATPSFSMKTVLLASLQSYRSVDADAWCKRALGQVFTRENILQAWWNTLKKSIHCVYHCMDHKRKYQHVRLHGNHCYPVFALNA